MDLKEIIGKYECSNISRMLMTADGKLHPCEDKSQVLHILQALVPDVPNSTANKQPEHSTHRQVPDNTVLIVDEMAEVNELIIFKKALKNCKNLRDNFVRAVANKSNGYTCVYVIFDNYNVESCMNDATRRRRTKGKSSTTLNHKVDDTTKINDFNTFLSSATKKIF